MYKTGLDKCVHNQHPAMRCGEIVKQLELGMRLTEVASVIMLIGVWIGGGFAPAEMRSQKLAVVDETMRVNECGPN